MRHLRVDAAVTISHVARPGPAGEPDGPEHRDATSPVMARRYQLVPAIAAFIVVLDQLTKQWAESALAGGPIVLIPGVLSLSFTENTGASFSLFQDGGTVLGLAALAAVGVIWYALRSVSHTGEVLGLALIMGGAIGNFVDRVVRGDGILDGPVIDFIALPNFPHFNVADSAITMGAVVLIWSAFRAKNG